MTTLALWWGLLVAGLAPAALLAAYWWGWAHATKYWDGVTMLSRGLRDNADKHIDKLQGELVAAREAYGKLVTTPPDARAAAYVRELQALLVEANRLDGAVLDVLVFWWEITQDLERPLPRKPIVSALLEDADFIIKLLTALSTARGGWAKAKSAYLARGNGPSPESAGPASSDALGSPA